MPRVHPLEPPYAREVDDQLTRMMPAGQPPIALFRTFARNLSMTAAMHPWGSYELGPTLSLTMRDREIIIERTCARCGCEYEWGVHVLFFAQRAGLNSKQVASLTSGHPEDACWSSERDRMLIRAVDELHDANDISDELWSALSQQFDDRELLDLLLLCGWYHAISYVARATRVDPEPGAPTFAEVAANEAT